MHHLGPTDADAALLATTMQQENLDLLSEELKTRGDPHLDEIVPKPWGHEYRVYADSLFDFWKLQMSPGQTTSLHDHPRKRTTLLCLQGEGIFHLLGRSFQVAAMDVINIGRGVFHATECTGSGPLDLIEVETPRNKFDLVRAADRYGRRGTEYERDVIEDCRPLEDGHLRDRSRVRAVSLGGEFEFDVRAGMDLLCRPDKRMLFAVSLDVLSVLKGTIVVHEAPVSEEVKELGLYWTISSTI